MTAKLITIGKQSKLQLQGLYFYYVLEDITGNKQGPLLRNFSKYLPTRVIKAINIQEHFLS